MNTPLVIEHYTKLINILNNNINLIGKKEFKNRIKKIKKVYEQSLEANFISNQFYSLSHEIRAIDLFSNFDNVRVSKDNKNEPGIDLYYKNYLIECVICTKGNASRYFDHDKNSIIGDYDEISRQISLRILSVLKSKKDKYTNDLEQGIFDNDSPFIIFINLGCLTQEWFPGEYCFSATRFLIGKGNSQLPINLETGNIIAEISYEYCMQINNNNDSSVITNFFGDIKNTCVSAVIITTADLTKTYTKENTVIFTNPFAKNKLQISDFKNFVYWEKNEKDFYIVNLNGKELKLKNTFL